MARWTAWTVVFLLGVSAAGAWWARGELRRSLPQIEGETRLTGLAAPVAVARDALGIPKIRGQSREDVARATGFVHAQDRFFQMDLSRRRAAGELAALVGVAALRADREIRIHRFRAEAHRAVDLLNPDQRRILDAYTSGVNAGLSALAASPFEYLLLRQQPAPWRAEDSLLVVLSMFVTLQESNGEFESTLATMQAVLPQQVIDFLVPAGTDWDTPVVGDRLTAAPIPSAEVYDLRARRLGRPTGDRPVAPRSTASLSPWIGESSEAIGSNNWAVEGRLADGGGALVANDMHLGIRVPNTWYRAMLEWDGAAGATGSLVGVTLPGLPGLVVGSNTHVAWGFTNTYADWSDIVLLETDPSRPDEYRTPQGWQRFERFTESIAVAGEAAQTLSVRWTIWGPVLSQDFMGRARAYRWVAHSAEQLAVSLTPLEQASTIDEAFDGANGIGAPGQNLVVADRSGRIGWSIFGSIPRRVGLDGRLPSSWSDGSRGWSGWLDRAEYPRIVDPPAGRLWTANARVVDGAMLQVLGDGNWEVGSRARIISERLFARQRFSAQDLLAIQLDTRAEFLERWRQLILETLSPSAIDSVTSRQAFRDVVDFGWNGEAATDSAAYRLTRAFRDTVSERVFSFVLSECYDADPTFDYRQVRRREGPLWTLVTERPQHLLDPAYARWEDLLIASVDAVVAGLVDTGSEDLGRRVWSEMNVTTYRHPLSGAVPFLGRWLDMPQQALPGDLYTPRMHWGADGASERMVVSPGREAEGIMHMPTGQSGHPLSPFYANSHDAWINGRATPLLPGTAIHTLTLTP